MDRQLIDYYLQELQHLREMGGEFAQAYPKVAQRLALDSVPCADPYVERLLEGFALLSARIRHKLDAEFPRFTQALLDTVYPHYLMPTPSMTIVQFQPDPAEAALADGWLIPRGSLLRSIPGKGDRTYCQFSTAHDVTLWPLLVDDVKYHVREATQFIQPADGIEAKSVLRMSLQITAGLQAAEVAVDRLTFHLRDRGNENAMHLYERLCARCTGVMVQWQEAGKKQRITLPDSSLNTVGFSPQQALLPCDNRVFDGHRLLREYFAFPQRFMFLEVSNLASALSRCRTRNLDLIFAFSDADPDLERNVATADVELNCTPAINMFRKDTDRIHVTNRASEFRVVPDRTKPIDFEVLKVLDVQGYGADISRAQRFSPFYAAVDSNTGNGETSAYFTVHRTRRTQTRKELEGDRRSSYLGSDVSIALVDRAAAPYRTDLRELSVSTLCSNRDLPIHMPVGVSDSDFTLDVNAPLKAIRCINRPTPPLASHVERPSDWRAISHLSLNYLSLVNDQREGRGATALRDMLKLYVDENDADALKQLGGLQSVSSQTVTRRLYRQGPLAFARGLEVTLTFNEGVFRGSGVFLLGAVLERFLSQYVTINSFVETVLKSTDRGEIMRWPPRNSMRPLL